MSDRPEKPTDDLGQLLSSNRNSQATLDPEPFQFIPYYVKQHDCRVDLELGHDPDIEKLDNARAVMNTAEPSYSDIAWNLMQRAFKHWNRYLTDVPQVDIPGFNVHRLKEYQKTGVRQLKMIEDTFNASMLADTMGLGKTVQALAFILWQYQFSVTKAPTLIIVPRGLLQQWTAEMKSWVSPRDCKFVCCTNIKGYDEGLKCSISELEECKIVMTTYETVRQQWSQYQADLVAYQEGREFVPDHQRISTVLFSIKWERLVADEVHVLRQPKTMISQAMFHLRAEKRCGITGTPFWNSTRDLLAMFRYLMLTPWTEYDSLKNHFARKQQGRVNHPDHLQQDVLAIMLWALLVRRTEKDVTDLVLPKLRRMAFIVNLDAHKKITYRKSDASMLEEMTEADVQDDAKTAYEKRFSGVKKVKTEMMASDYNRILLNTIHVRAHEAYFKPKSMDDPGHKERLNPEWVIQMKENQNWQSTKLTALVARLPKFLDEHNKLIIFDRHVAVLELVGIALGACFPAVDFVEISGRLTYKQREIAATKFRTDPRVRVLLATIDCLGQGHNLIEATMVIFLGPNYTPEKKEQAAKRIHRIGQTKECTIVNMKATDSMDTLVETYHVKHKMKQRDLFYKRDLNEKIETWKEMSKKDFKSIVSDICFLTIDQQRARFTISHKRDPDNSSSDGFGSDHDDNSEPESSNDPRSSGDESS